MFIISILLGVVALIALFAFLTLKRRQEKRTAGFVFVFTALASAGAMLLASTYIQNVGEAKVLKSWSGEVVGQDIESGFAWKAPTTREVNFDVRNQQATYIGNGEGDNVTGPQITVKDKDGVRSDVDLQVLYSIKPDSVTDIYYEHQNQETFKSRVVEQDIRSVTRTIPGKFSTQQLLNDRAGVEKAVFDALTERWTEKGIILESVALQEVRPPKEVLDRYADAQAAQAQVAKENALLEAAEVKAQQKIVEATAEAEANNVLTKSLTPEVLQQRQLDTLRAIGEKGNLVVVPEGSTPMVQVQK